MILGKNRRNRAKPRWLHLLVLLAALTSISGQAFESGHVHFDAQPADCWVCHSGAAAVASHFGTCPTSHIHCTRSRFAD